MTTLTIPKQLINQEIILVPAKEYREFLSWKRQEKNNKNTIVKEFSPTKAQLKILARARKNYAKGTFATLAP